MLHIHIYNNVFRSMSLLARHLLAAICNDEEVTRARRVEAFLASKGPNLRTPRRLQSTTSEAGIAHQASDTDSRVERHRSLLVQNIQEVPGV